VSSGLSLQGFQNADPGGLRMKRAKGSNRKDAHCREVSRIRIIESVPKVAGELAGLPVEEEPKKVQ